MDGHFHHLSVLADEAIEALCIDPSGNYVDATLGAGGHAERIARQLSTGRLFGFDRDEDAITAAGRRLKRFGGRVRLIHEDFRNMKGALEAQGVAGVDGILFDLGVSSPQLDDAGRGFSYMHDAPLDMRMDRQAALSAAEIINSWPEEEIKRILFEYGEERHAGRIASAIVRRRQIDPVETTGQLVQIIRSAMPPQALREKQHPAKRTFQAVRIAVNDELGALKQALEAAVALINPGGRIAVISFHSLEDRIVKECFARHAKGCVCPPDFPACVCGIKPKLKLITKKPTEPDAAETQQNPRARSAKLRVAQGL